MLTVIHCRGWCSGSDVVGAGVEGSDVIGCGVKVAMLWVVV